MNESFLEIAFWLGRLTRFPLLDFFLSMLAVLVLARLTIWVIRSAIPLLHDWSKFAGTDYEPIHEAWAEDMAAGIPDYLPPSQADIRRASWKRFFTRCAWAFFIALSCLAVYVFAMIAWAL
jgi:hypothetical protein